jgi:hypothetical protein
MKTRTLLVIFIAVLAGLLAVYFWKSQLGEKKPVPVAQTPPSPPPAAQPAPPVPAPKPPAAAEPEKPLPTLAESDPAMRESLSELFPRQNLGDLFFLKHFIQRFVLMVDNLPRHELPYNRLPVKPASGRFLTTGEEGSEFLSPANYKRYTPYVRLAELVDTGRLVAVYARFYPLFQEAYQQLGYPSGNFNHRLIEVIDHLLAAPDVQGPIRVVHPMVRYKFADPDLEALSAGQKILIRMGPDNAGKVKAKLRDIRRELTARIRLTPPAG